MRLTLLLVLATTAFSTQARPVLKPEPMLARVQSADSAQQPTIQITIEGSLFKSLGIARGTSGTLSLRENGGTGSGILRAELSTEPGVLVFSAPPIGPELELSVWPPSGAAVPRYQARGHTVSVTRSASGVLSVHTDR